METTYTRPRKNPQPVHYDVEDSDALYETRMPSSTRRYKSYDTIEEPITRKDIQIQHRRSNPNSNSGISSSAVVAVRRTGSVPETHHRKNSFALLALLLGMVATIALLMSMSMLQSWWQTYQDDAHYGRPRIAQLDAVVGHNDSTSNKTHFIFLNLHGHIEIIEIPGGDASHTRAFNGPTLFGSSAELAPVTGTIRNENGHIDLIVHVQDQQIVYINDGTTFHPQSQ